MDRKLIAAVAIAVIVVFTFFLPNLNYVVCAGFIGILAMNGFGI